MSKGSKRRRENAALVEANWPFPDRRKAIPRYPSPKEFTPEEIRSSYIPCGCADRPDGTRRYVDGALGQWVDGEWVVVSLEGVRVR